RDKVSPEQVYCEAELDEEDARGLHVHDQPLSPREFLDRMDLLLVRQPRCLALFQCHRSRGAVRHASSPSCVSSSSEGSSGGSSASSSSFGSGLGGGGFGAGASATGGGAADCVS